MKDDNIFLHAILQHSSPFFSTPTSGCPSQRGL